MIFYEPLQHCIPHVIHDKSSLAFCRAQKQRQMTKAPYLLLTIFAIIIIIMHSRATFHGNGKANDELKEYTSHE